MPHASKEHFRKLTDITDTGLKLFENGVLQLIREWLGSAAIGPWLIVLDDVDDLVHCRSSEKNLPSLIQYLPHPKTGRMLITTCREDVASSLTDAKESRIEVTSLKKSEAITLFRKRLSDDITSDTQLEELAQVLGYLPLAMNLAASYCESNSTSLENWLQSDRGVKTSIDRSH